MAKITVFGPFFGRFFGPFWARARGPPLKVDRHGGPCRIRSTFKGGCVHGPPTPQLKIPQFGSQRPRDPKNRIPRVRFMKIRPGGGRGTLIGPVLSHKWAWPMYALVYPARPGPGAAGPGPARPGPGQACPGPQHASTVAWAEYNRKKKITKNAKT